MGNKSSTKLRDADLDYFHHKTTFTDSEIRELNDLFINHTKYDLFFIILRHVDDWYKCFHKDCPNGQLTCDEFKKIYAQFFPTGDSSAFAEHVFRRFDVDHNQRISFQEFLTALSITSKGNLDEKLDWAFGLYDTNGDGFITREEMLEIVTVSCNLVIDFRVIMYMDH